MVMSYSAQKCHKTWKNLEVNMSNSAVTLVPADGLAPVVSRTSTGRHSDDQARNLKRGPALKYLREVADWATKHFCQAQYIHCSESGYIKYRPSNCQPFVAIMAELAVPSSHYKTRIGYTLFSQKAFMEC